MVLENSETFLTLPTEAIVELVQEIGRPKVGIFVPDGSRRLVLALTNAKPNTEEFYRLCATLPAQHLLESLKVFFNHGLPVLLVPILSRSVINRGNDYQRFTALSGLKLLFADETWLNFYEEYDVRVRVYGEKMQLAGTECEPAIEWIDDAHQRTDKHQTHSLFYAIGETPLLGQDIAETAVAFYQEYGRGPTVKEQIQQYYGQHLSPANFFIMTSKMSGLAALPRFLVNGDTEAYFLPAAGAMGLNSQTYRLILYDLLAERSNLHLGTYGDRGMESETRQALQSYYQQVDHSVIGLGRQIGTVWVPEVC